MAITQTSDKAASNSATFIDIPAPSGAAAGIFTTIETVGNGAGNLSMTGWSEDDTTTEAVEGSVMSVFSKTLDGGEGSTYRVTNSTTSDRLTGVAKCHAGAGGYDVPPGASTRNTYSSYPSTMTAPDITTGIDGAHHNVFAAIDSTVASFNSYPSGYTQSQLENATGQRMASYYKEITTAGSTGGQNFGNDTGVNGYGVSYSVSPSAPITQNAFRFGLDDGTESGHSWDQNENTNTTLAAATARLIRLQAEALGNPVSADYDLYYQKNGAGGYAIIPIGATVSGTPDIGTPDEATTGGSASTTVSFPQPTGLQTGDLIVLFGMSESSNTDNWSSPSAPDDYTKQSSGNNSQDVQGVIYYKICDGDETWPLTVTHSTASDYAVGWSSRIPAGQFNASNPINAIGSWAGLGSTGSSLTIGGLTTTVDGCLILALVGTDGSDISPSSYSSGAGWGAPAYSIEDPSNNAGGVGADLYQQLQASYGTVADLGVTFGGSDGRIGVMIAIEPGAGSDNDVYVDASSNISASGADPTTDRLSTNDGGTFQAGARIDDLTGVTVDLGDTYRTQLEWRINTKSGLSDATYFEFRLYKNGAALDGGYDYTPKLTIGTAGGTVIDRSLSDSVAAADTMGPARQKTRTATETIAVIDAALRQAVKNRTTTDAISTTDAALRLGVIRQRSGTDAATIYDLLGRDTRLTRGLADEAAIVDALTADLTSAGRLLTKLLADQLEVSDNTYRTAEVARLLTEQTDIATSVGRLAERLRTLNDSADTTDALTRSAEAIRTLLDAVPAYDALASALEGAGGLINKLLSEQIDAQDVLVRTAEITRNAYDGTEVTDAADATKTLLRLTAENVAVLDQLHRAAELARTLPDAATLNDLLTGAREVSRQTLDAVDISDDALRGAFLYRLALDAIQLSDTLSVDAAEIIQAAIAILARATRESISANAARPSIITGAAAGAPIHTGADASSIATGAQPDQDIETGSDK